MCGISPGFPKIPSEFPQNLELISKFEVLHRHTCLSNRNNKEHFINFNTTSWTSICGVHFLEGSILKKSVKIVKNGRFVREVMAGLGKYRTGGYGRIGVYRVRLMSISNWVMVKKQYHFQYIYMALILFSYVHTQVVGCLKLLYYL